MNNVSIPRLPTWKSYNVIPTLGVAGTAKILLVNAAGDSIYYIANLVIPATACNIYTEVLARLTTDLGTAALANAVVNRVDGAKIVPSVELRYTNSGGVTGALNAPAPVATSIDYWAAGIGYLLGEVANG